ncbi:succinate dehydrogenase, hydrophobic membrane anchor protein [Pelagibacterium montanilacus]|uniref:succinate dehydrogenase, hydrophobic membrane anchor protein n=1 Tax=Pelagibacterium montanilacus TaxID=2185280 RepID=UPI000F8F5172|nr:succinate dehydrogenase, hydrophobic membrane anchor protein [Pelagibacterium montanilacus]
MSHHRGTGIFIQQRVTALTNIVVIGFLVWLVATLYQADRATIAATFSNPIVAILTLALLGSVLFHMRIGMGEIIEDYVHEPRLNSLALALNTVFVLMLGVVGAFSVLVLAFGG